MAVDLHLKNITKTFIKDGVKFDAVERVDLEVAGGELVTFLGPSGCGKTTTLRMVAGFEAPTSGRILIDGADVTEVMVNKREIGFVFQNYALFPHMTIGDNVGYGLIINRLEREITEYLIELSQHNLPEENAQLVSILYHTINDVERIGDHAENIVELAMSKINNKIEMSDEALSEMNEIFQITIKSLDIAIKSFENNKNNNDINEEIEDKIDTLEKKFRNNNIARLNAKQCYANAGVMFFDLLSNLERIGDHANNISNIKEEYTHKIYI